MLWFLAFHLIFVVCWFAGLFYLPRLFVYHVKTTDAIGQERFKTMERKLYYAITLPSGLLATLFGLIVLSYNFKGYMQARWLHWKLLLVVILWIYTLVCGRYVKQFKQGTNQHSEKFFRFFNEVPALLLVAIVILVVVKPF